MTRHLLTIAHHVLGGRGFMVHIARIDVGTMLEQELRDLDSPRKMKRRLTVTATRMHQVRVCGDEVPQSSHLAKARRSVNIHDRATSDRIPVSYTHLTLPTSDIV